MDDTQQQLDSFPTTPTPRPRRKSTRIFLAAVTFTLAIAVIWALNDIGWIAGPWGKLALIFFTWLAVAIGSWALLRGKE